MEMNVPIWNKAIATHEDFRRAVIFGFREVLPDAVVFIDESELNDGFINFELPGHNLLFRYYFKSAIYSNYLETAKSAGDRLINLLGGADD